MSVGLVKWALILIVSLYVIPALGHNVFLESGDHDGCYAEQGTSLWRQILTETEVLERLTTIRSFMEEYEDSSSGLAAIIIPTADAHMSQYLAPIDARREWISGFTGSAGTAVITHDAANIWTDSRYYLQFEIDMTTNHWDLMESTAPSQATWLGANLQEGDLVGANPEFMSYTTWNTLAANLASQGLELVPVTDDLVDKTRMAIEEEIPERPNSELEALPIEFSGRTVRSKIDQLRTVMAGRSVGAMVLTALDEIAHVLNTRGQDISFNPVFFSYVIIRPTGPIVIYWGEGVIPPNIVQLFADEDLSADDYEGRPYVNFYGDLDALGTEMVAAGQSVWLAGTSSRAAHLHLNPNGDVNVITEATPVPVMKVIKNEVELQGIRACHEADAIAVIRFFRWLHEKIDNDEPVSEIDTVNKILELRSENDDFRGPSFSTIAGSGANGAIVHYSPSPDLDPIYITKSDVLLFDSGGQYRTGTTDITRTRHMGEPTDDQRKFSTLVMKGQIALATAIFPAGTRGVMLDTLARQYLWSVGVNYGHGTGHGVGHFLNVHEGPSGIGSMANDPGIFPGMIFSDEPGHYETGEYGIRHEDLVETVLLTADSDHIKAPEIVGDFNGVGAIGFRALSLVPYQREFFDLSMMTEFELEYLDRYHTRVLDTIGPLLQDMNLQEDYEWLVSQTLPLSSPGEGENSEEEEPPVENGSSEEEEDDGNAAASITAVVSLLLVGLLVNTWA